MSAYLFTFLILFQAYDESLLFLLSDGMCIMSVTFVMTLHQLPLVEVPLNTFTGGHQNLVLPYQPWKVLPHS